jgi:hypothetical protein
MREHHKHNITPASAGAKVNRIAIDLPVDAVVYREDLYPRIKTDVSTVQKYAEDLTVLPPIEVNQHNILIDGWHRWTAHKKNGAATVPAIVTETNSDAHLLELSIERNAAHGLQLSQEDKRNMARSIYHSTPERERDEKKKHLSRILSVSERTVREWLGRIDKDAKAERDRRIFEMWMQCYTQEEIAEAVGIPQRTVADNISGNGNIAEFAKTDRAAAEHATDFEPPIYNIWKQQTKTDAGKHFGNSEVRWVDNLLYLYTQPFDTVIDPFAGSGSTLDIARKRFRRAYISDRKPIVEREKEIRQHDLIAEDGIIALPKVPRWKDVKLVYLDPPYWKQAENQYSTDPTDLANMPIEDFNRALAGIIKGFATKLNDAYIALIIQPTQWKAPERQFTDHIGDMLRAVNLPVEMRYSVPYESQQHNAQMVEWAKENKRCLVLTREIVVWRVP